MSRVRPQPFHQPIGISDERFPPNRRFLGLLLLVAAVLVMAVLSLYRQ